MGPNIRSGSRAAWRAGASGAAVALVTATGYILRFNAATVVLLYLLVIAWQSLDGGFAISTIISLAAAICLDFFFLPPPLSFRISGPLNVLAFAVFLAISLVMTRLVSRLRAESHAAKRRGANLEQLNQVARQLLLARPDRVSGESLLRTIGELFPNLATCLFDGDSAEHSVLGVSSRDLPERTKQAYLSGEDCDDREAAVAVRCLRAGKTITGAIGFEGLAEPEWVVGPLSVLVSAALEQARAFRKASHERAAAEAEVLRTAILDALAHEFKTSLATILAVVGGLRESPKLGPEQAELAGMIELETSRLNDLTNRLLRMARLDREEIKPRMRSTDIASLVEAIAQRYSTQTPDRHIVVDAHGTAQAQADRPLLDLAVTQLLDNAFKYSAAGSEVAVGIEVEGEQITLRVRNEGSSIAPAEQNRIFERFYRGAGVRNLVSGAGLGLYVARKIAVAHGGSLELDKTARVGTVVFCLKLPLVNQNGTHHRPINH